MKLRILLGCFFLQALYVGAWSQTATDDNEGTKLEYDSANDIWRFKWWAKAGRTYFVLHSEDLVTWTWVPIVEPGDASVKEWGFTSTTDKFFLRLKYTDQATSDPEGDDFDNDGVSNLEEVQNGTDPLSLPAAANQLQALSLSDGRVLLSWNDNSTNETGFIVERSDDGGETWSALSTEAANATHYVIGAAFAGASTSLFRVTPLNGAGSAASIDSGIGGEFDENGNDDTDPLTNIEEIELGTNPFKADTDGDLLADNFDGWATVQELAPARLPLVRYALIDLGVGQGAFVNDKGQAVYYNGASKYFWESGVSTPITPPVDTVWNSTIGLTNSGEVVLGVRFPLDYHGPGWNMQDPNKNAGTNTNKGTVMWTPSAHGDLIVSNIFTAAKMQALEPTDPQSYYETMPVVRYNVPIAVSSNGKVAAYTQEYLNGEGPPWSTYSAVIFIPAGSLIGDFFLNGGATNAPTEGTRASLLDINSAGVAIGSYTTLENGVETSGYAYWTGSKHGLDEAPRCINDEGHIFGNGVMWLANHNYKKLVLDNAPAGYINNKLQSVAGTGLWQNYQWHDLTELTDLTGWSNFGATRISSDNGIIVGTATKTADGLQHAVMLLPIEITTKKDSPNKPWGPPVWGRTAIDTPLPHEVILSQADVTGTFPTEEEANEAEKKAFKEALVIYYKDALDANGQLAADVDIDFKVRNGTMPDASWSHSITNRTPDNPPAMEDSATAWGKLKGLTKAGIYRYNLHCLGVNTGVQAWLPSAGPDITSYWQGEINYFKNTWGPAYRTKLLSRTWFVSLMSAELGLATRELYRIQDIIKLGPIVDWTDSNHITSTKTPCGLANVVPQNFHGGDRDRFTMFGVVTDFSKRNNMMYALIGREIGLPEIVIRNGPDTQDEVNQLLGNPNNTGTPDSPAAFESYEAGFDLFDGISLQQVITTRGKNMQEPGSRAQKEWPSSETTTQGLKREAEAILTEMIQ
jgi:hypothetical protein